MGSGSARRAKNDNVKSASLNTTYDSDSDIPMMGECMLGRSPGCQKGWKKTNIRNKIGCTVIIAAENLHTRASARLGMAAFHAAH